ncbi:MAG: helix-turn-helix domain-containing protein [Myxococcota bacterium]|jgi:excisionase family DNA binding protein
MAGVNFQRKKPENGDAGAGAPSGVVPTAPREQRAQPDPGSSEIMTRTEVAALLRCSEPHVLTLVERAGLPAFRLGKLWRFRRSEVLAWCEGGPHGRRSA